MAKLGFLGLGAMGYPMARNLLRAGHQVALWSHSGEKARRARGMKRNMARRVARTATRGRGPRRCHLSVRGRYRDGAASDPGRERRRRRHNPWRQARHGGGRLQHHQPQRKPQDRRSAEGQRRRVSGCALPAPLPYRQHALLMVGGDEAAVFEDPSPTWNRWANASTIAGAPARAFRLS